MKIHFLSDTHLDFFIKELNPCEKMDSQLLKFIDFIGVANIPENDRDVFIIPGDLGHYFQQNKRFLEMLKTLFRHVILVAGNHDYYLVSESQQKRYNYDSKNRFLELKRFCIDNGIHYLDGDVVCIEGYNFAGVGMYFDKYFLETLEKRSVSDGEIREFYSKSMNDINYIMFGHKPYRVPLAYGHFYIQSSLDPIEFFRKEQEKLQRINDYDNVDVMISHFCPMIPYGMPEEYIDDPVSTFFLFNGYKDIERISPKIWLYGHMHNNYDFKYKETRLLCNPLGYPGETDNKYKTIEI